MSSDAALQFAAVLDALIPGDDGRWPAFSAAVDVAYFAENCAPDIRHSLATLEQKMKGLALAERAPAIAAWETAAPQAFAQLLRTAHRSYYTAPRVLASITALADAGPRETSPQFDPTLVAQVVATSAGRRRL